MFFVTRRVECMKISYEFLQCSQTKSMSWNFQPDGRRENQKFSKMVIFETLFKLKGVLQMGFPNDFGPLAPRKIEKAQHFQCTIGPSGRWNFEVKNQRFQPFSIFLLKKCLFLDLKSQKIKYFYQENPSEPFSDSFCG